ncbi:MAG: DUF4126 domain-containing protein [bacterium]|nr:DUF4126 domain-containing protein [bacterium]
MEILLSLAVGIGLSAACGFRIFIPFLIMSIAARTGHLELAGGFDWISSTPAIIGFASATVLEIAAYYLPLIDNLLDTIAAPSAVVAGVVATASQVADLDPWLAWSVAIVAGGGAAGAVQGLTTVVRQLSAMATAGFGNPLVSTVEAGGSLMMSMVAVVFAPLAVFGFLVLLYFTVKKVFFRHKPAEAA